MNNKKILLKSSISLLLIIVICSVISLYLNHISNKEENENKEQIIMLLTNFIKDTTSLGTEKDIKHENYFYSDNFHRKTRLKSCELSLNKFHKDSINFTDCNKLVDLSQFSEMSFSLITSQFSSLDNIKINKLKENEALVKFDLELKVQMTTRKGNDSASDLSLVIYETAPNIKILGIEVILKKEQQKWKIYNTRKVNNRIKQFYSLWDGKGNTLYIDDRLQKVKEIPYGKK